MARTALGAAVSLPMLLLIGLAVSAAPAAPKQPTSEKEAATRRTLRDAERLRAEQLDIARDAAARADRAEAEAARLAAERVAAAARLQQADAATQEVATRIDALAARHRDAEQRLKQRASAMQPMLPLIERLSLYPVETLLALPASPEATLRGVMVLRGLSRQMQAEAVELRNDQTALRVAGDALAAELPRLAAVQAEQARSAALLDRQIALAHAEHAKAETDASLAAGLAAAQAARMDTLHAALDVLEAQARVEAARARDEAQRAEQTRKPVEQPAERQREAMLVRPGSLATLRGMAGFTGRLQPPVTGMVVKGWGEATDAGPATGVSYNAPPAARVVSPCGGRVVFADDFRSYGLLLIVDCGGGYHVVMAGFSRLDVKLGQRIVTAEPVGVMPSWLPGSDSRRPSLYIELRHDGQPINPTPWLKPRG